MPEGVAALRQRVARLIGGYQLGASIGAVARWRCAHRGPALAFSRWSGTASVMPGTRSARRVRVGDDSSARGTDGFFRAASTRIASIVSLALWW